MVGWDFYGNNNTKMLCILYYWQDGVGQWFLWTQYSGQPIQKGVAFNGYRSSVRTIASSNLQYRCPLKKYVLPIGKKVCIFDKQLWDMNIGREDINIRLMYHLSTALRRRCRWELPSSGTNLADSRDPFCAWRHHTSSTNSSCNVGLAWVSVQCPVKDSNRSMYRIVVNVAYIFHS